MTAIFRNSDRITSQARKSTDAEKHIIFQMWMCSSPYDLAPCLIAYKNVTGEFPPLPPTPLWHSAMKLVNLAYTDGLVVVHEGETPKGMVTDYDITPPSDEARRQAHEAREEAGYYKGIRRLSGKTDRVQINPVSQNQYPLHW